MGDLAGMRMLQLGERVVTMDGRIGRVTHLSDGRYVVGDRGRWLAREECCPAHPVLASVVQARVKDRMDREWAESHPGGMVSGDADRGVVIEGRVYLLNRGTFMESVG